MSRVDFLAADFQRLNPHIHQLDVDLPVETPETVVAGRQQLDHLTIDLEYADLERRHLGQQYRVQALQGLAAQAGLGELGDQCGVQTVLLAQINALQALFVLALPVQATAAGRQYFHQHAVLVAQACLVLGGIEALEVALDQCWLLFTQVTGQAVFKARAVQAEHFNAQVVARIEAAVQAGLQNGLEIAFGVQHCALVLFHH